MSGPHRTPLAPRSFFFVPGTRPELLAKVPRWSPDVVVLDLEDAVPADQKVRARAAVAETVAGIEGPEIVLIRVNPPGTPWFEDDVAAAAGASAAGVVLPKYERREQLDLVRHGLSEDAHVVVGIESGRGVADCRPLLDAPADAAYFGAEDFIADVGGRRTPGSAEVLYARSRVLLAAHLSGVGAIDQAVTDIGDDERFVADAEAGRAIGYTGKICVHPRQVELSHQVFTPTAEELAHAREVLTAFAAGGVGTVDGLMVDEVHVRMARQVLSRGER